jgi:hypothetical protein
MKSLVLALPFVVGSVGCAQRLPGREVEEPAPPADACERCAAEGSTPRATEPSRTYDASPRPAGVEGTRTLTMYPQPGDDPPPDRWSVRRIGADPHDDGRTRPPVGKRVDIDLVGAPFDDVARFLADTGRFNVVVEAPSAGTVTVKLRNIEPYDALKAIADVKGVAVSYRGGVVVVSNGSSARATE